MKPQRVERFLSTYPWWFVWKGWGAAQCQHDQEQPSPPGGHGERAFLAAGGEVAARASSLSVVAAFVQGAVALTQGNAVQLIIFLTSTIL